QKRYEKWCDKWVITKFTNSGTVWLSAQDCFQLRCSLIHSGSTQIEQTKRKGLDEIVFFDNEIKTHFNKVTGQTINGVKQPNVLQLNAEKLVRQCIWPPRHGMQRLLAMRQYNRKKQSCW